MSDDNTEVQETNEDSVEETDESGFRVDDLPPEAKKMIADLRRENAKHRTEKQAAKSKLEEYDSWKDSQLTELEKAQKRVAELEALEQSRSEGKRKEEVAKKVGLDPELADRLRGETEDELEADARAMVTLMGGKRIEDDSKPDAHDFFGGVTGKKPVGQKANKSSSTGWFDEFMKG